MKVIKHSQGTSACPSQHRLMQICGLKINTVRKETSHRENQYPAKDNGNSASSCDLPSEHQHLSRTAINAGQWAALLTAQFTVIIPANAGTKAVAPRAAKWCPFLAKCEQTMTSPNNWHCSFLSSDFLFAVYKEDPQNPQLEIKLFSLISEHVKA